MGQNSTLTGLCIEQNHGDTSLTIFKPSQITSINPLVIQQTLNRLPSWVATDIAKKNCFMTMSSKTNGSISAATAYFKRNLVDINLGADIDLLEFKVMALFCADKIVVINQIDVLQG